MKTKLVKRNVGVSLLLAVAMTLAMFAAMSINMTAGANAEDNNYLVISNPYKDVDWASWGQYKTGQHEHTHYSDGGNSRLQMVVDHYNKDFDILAITDHDILTERWDTNGAHSSSTGPLTSEQREQIINGTYPKNGRTKDNGMLEIPYTNEVSVTDHINTFWSNVPTSANGGKNMAQVLDLCEKAGGISHINHAGRYTGGAAGGDSGAAASNSPAQIKKYVDLFKAYPTCVGMEIVNKDDNESRSDKILWDNILMELLPDDRNVWGFGNDDAHSIGAVGYTWNALLMPELNLTGARTAMETGAFYAVSRIDRREGIDSMNLANATPKITDITVEGSVITIAGENYSSIDWIIDGAKAAAGNSNSIDLNNYSAKAYVRAQLKSSTGIAYTQPFAVKDTRPVQTEFEVSNDAEFRAAANKIGKGTGTIILADSFTMDSTSFTYSAGGDITVASADADNKAKLTMPSANDFSFWVTGTSTMRFEGVDIEVTRNVSTNPNGNVGSFGLQNSANVYVTDNSAITFTSPSGNNYSGFWFGGTGCTGALYVYDSVMTGVNRTIYGFNGAGPNAYILNSSITGGSATIYRVNAVLSGSTAINGNTSGTAGFDGQGSCVLVDYRNCEITAEVPEGTAGAVLAKTGTGAAVSGGAYQIYYSVGAESDPKLGQLYSNPIILLNDDTIIKAVIKNGNYFDSTTYKFVLSPDAPAAVDGITVASAPFKTVYEPGEALDLAGLVVLATIGSSSVTLDSGDYTLSITEIPAGQSGGFMQITVIYAGDAAITAQFKILIAAEGVDEIAVSSQAEFMTAAKFFNGKTGTIVLSNSFNFIGGTDNASAAGLITLGNGTDLTIKGAGGDYAESTITLAGRTNFTLFGDAQLTLDGIRLNGNRPYYSDYKYNGISIHGTYDFLFAAMDTAKMNIVGCNFNIAADANANMTYFGGYTVCTIDSSNIYYQRTVLYSTASTYQNVTWILKGTTVIKGTQSYRGTFILYDEADHQCPFTNESTIIDFRNCGVNVSLNGGLVTLTKTGTATAAAYSIVYTLDGSDPMTSATRQTYAAPFSVSGDVTIKATLVNSGRYWNNTVTYEYEEDVSATTYTVTFNLNGGQYNTGAPIFDPNYAEPQTVAEGKNAVRPLKDPVHTSGPSNYAFVNWYTVDGEKFDFNTPITDDITLIAKWLGRATTNVPYASKIKLGQEIVLSYPSDANVKIYYYTNMPGEPEYDTIPMTFREYTGPFAITGFSGSLNSVFIWVKVVLDGVEKTGLVGATQTGVYTIYYELEKYTVTFDGNGGSETGSQIVYKGDKAGMPADPAKDGYTFIGWTLDGTAYDFNAGVNGNIALAAEWEVITVVKDLQTLVDEANDGDTVVVITAEINALKAAVTIAAGKNITITAEDGVVLTTESGRHFIIEQNAALTLENIVLDGKGVCGGIENKGTLTLGGGAAVINCFGPAIQSSGKLTVLDGALVSSAYSFTNMGVIHLNGGTVGETALEIIGGKIENTGSGCVVSNAAAGTVSIEGGEIAARGSTAAAIYNGANGTLSILGGVILGNTAVNNSALGEVNVSDGELIAATYGIYNYSNGNLNLSGGLIKATGTNGFAIYCVSALCLVSVSGDCVLSSANTTRGTVYLDKGNVDRVILQVSGGKIENTSLSGYAVYNNGTGTVSISGGEVSSAFRAVYNIAQGAVSISGGKVSAANADGYAVYNEGNQNNRYGTVTLGGSPDITGIIRVSADTRALASATGYMKADALFNPGEKTYRLQFFTQYALNALAIADGAGFESSFILVGNANGYVLTVSGNNLILAVPTFVVAFDTDGGSEIASVTVNKGATAAKPADPTKDGYTFIGWTLNGNAYDFNTPVNGNITLIASWTVITYTVTFDLNGGHSGVPAILTVNHGGTITLPPAAAKNSTADYDEGWGYTYTFAGWFTEKEGGELFTNETPVTADITLYAQWIENEIPSVTFDYNDGRGVYAKRIIGTDGTVYFYPSEPGKEGYTFDGWFTQDGIQFTDMTSLTEHITVYAKWTAIPVTIINVANAKFASIKEASKGIWTLTFSALITYSDGSSKTVVYTIDLNGNNANLDGKYTFATGHDLEGYTLAYDIKGNGSNIKEFKLTK